MVTKTKYLNSSKTCENDKMLDKITGRAGNLGRLALLGLGGILGAASGGCDLYYAERPVYYQPAQISRGNHLPTGLYVGTSWTDFDRDGDISANEINELGNLNFPPGKNFCFVGMIRNPGFSNISLELYHQETGEKFDETVGQSAGGSGVYLISNGSFRQGVPKNQHVIGILKQNGREIRRTTIVVNP